MRRVQDLVELCFMGLLVLHLGRDLETTEYLPEHLGWHWLEQQC